MSAQDRVQHYVSSLDKEVCSHRIPQTPAIKPESGELIFHASYTHIALIGILT